MKNIKNNNRNSKKIENVSTLKEISNKKIYREGSNSTHEKN
jgi:hypothetical protein